MSHILVTGAAGLIGGEVCARLVAAGHRVTALIRNNPEIRGNDRSSVQVAEILKGDVELPDMGLPEDAVARLAGSVDLVIHCAASIRFDLSDADYDAVNVGGTANAIDFARHVGARLLYVSTAYACGLRDGIIEEAPVPQGVAFANGYEKSKAKAEALVRDSALHFAIARPAIVLGHSETGAIRGYDGIYAAFRLIAEGRIRAMPVREDGTLDFVPIDHVAGGIVAIAERMEAAAGGTFHLVSADPLPVQDFAEAIARYPQFHRPTLTDHQQFDADVLPPLERRLHNRVAGLYASYFQRDPRFDDAHFRALTGMESGPADLDYMQRQIDFCIADGFLPAATAMAE